MLYIQLIGFLGFLILLLSYYRKTKNQILTYQIVAEFAYATHYFLLGGISGAFTCVINMFRGLVFKKERKYKRIFVCIFIFLYLLVGIVFYEKLYSIFPMLAAISYLISLSKKTKKELLIGSLFSSTFWLIYEIFVLSYAGMVGETIFIISSIYQLKTKRYN